MKKAIQVEICCGSLQDVISASRFPISRIELNSCLEEGGLTPSFMEFLKAKDHTTVPIMVMIRPRKAGFCYSGTEKDVMFADAELFLKHEADGIVFGFLNPDQSIDLDSTSKMCSLIHSYGKTAVFHKAFDKTTNADQAVKDLISVHVDRILTSGHADNALEGINEIRHLLDTYGSQLEILPGGGIRGRNAAEIIMKTSAGQIHSSCSTLLKDGNPYQAVSALELNRLFQALGKADHIQSFSREDSIPEPDIEMMTSDAYEEKMNHFTEDEDERL